MLMSKERESEQTLPERWFLGLTRFGGHLINPAKFRVEVFDDQIREGKGEAGTAGV